MNRINTHFLRSSMVMLLGMFFALSVSTASANNPDVTAESNTFIDAALPDPHILAEAAAASDDAYHMFSHGRPGALLVEGSGCKVRTGRLSRQPPAG